MRSKVRGVALTGLLCPFVGGDKQRGVVAPELVQDRPAVCIGVSHGQFQLAPGGSFPVIRTGTVAAAFAVSPPPTCTVGKANRMPFSSKAFLIIESARRRMTNCSFGFVIILRRSWIA